MIITADNQNLLSNNWAADQTEPQFQLKCFKAKLFDGDDECKVAKETAKRPTAAAAAAAALMKDAKLFNETSQSIISPTLLLLLSLLSSLLVRRERKVHTFFFFFFLFIFSTPNPFAFSLLTQFWYSPSRTIKWHIIKKSYACLT